MTRSWSTRPAPGWGRCVGGPSPGGAGGPTAIKQGNLNDQVFTIVEGVANLDHKESIEFEKAFRAKYNGQTFWYPRAANEMRMFAAAAEKAKSLEPVKVAAALEGLEFEVFNGGKGFMRKDDIARHVAASPLTLRETETL